MAALPLTARTITLTVENCDRVAAISGAAPRYGWVGSKGDNSFFDTNQLNLSTYEAVLLCFRLEAIPKDQRVVRAELVIPVANVHNQKGGLYVWKLLVPWGVGASYRDRQARPERVAWNLGGARGPGSDRAREPSVVLRLTSETGEISLNVTADVDLWHSGSLANYGWILCGEVPGEAVRVPNPQWSPRSWKLRITYEKS